MFNHKKLVLKVARRQLLTSRLIQRYPTGNLFCRRLSSVSPKFEDEDDVPAETWRKKQQAVKQMLQQQRMPVQGFSRVEQSEAMSDPSTLELNNPSNDVESLQVRKDAGTSPSELTYTGNVTMPITSRLHIVTPQEDTPRGVWPVFRLMVSFGGFS
jgi:hypothetical protein